jgi:hypothetical protein
MRKFLALCLGAFLALAPVDAFAIALVQSTGAAISNQAGTTITTPAITTTAGNTLIACLADFIQGGTNTVVSVTGPGQTWTQLIDPNTGTGTSSNWGAWICQNCAALSSQVITGTDTGANNHYLTIAVAEVSGVPASGVADLHENTATASTTTPSFTTAGTTAQASEIAFDCMSQSAGHVTVTEASGWNQLQDNYNAANQVGMHFAYKTLSATGTVTYNPTLSGALANNISVMTLKASGAVAVCRRSLLGVGC